MIREPVMIEVAGGAFVLGGDPEKPPYSDEIFHPAKGVTLDSFLMGATPVTVGEWLAFVGETGYEWNYEDQLRDVAPSPAHPAGYVSWYDCMAFCDWLAQHHGKPYSLPTEIQWEKASRGSDGRIYPWGDTDVLDEHAVLREVCTPQAKPHTLPVGRYPDLCSPWGCHDMCANVGEWCVDWFVPPNLEADELAEWTDEFKVIRGGSALDGMSSLHRSFQRPDFRHGLIGFRLLVDECRPPD